MTSVLEPNSNKYNIIIYFVNIQYTYYKYQLCHMFYSDLKVEI